MSTLVFTAAVIAIVIVVVWCIQNDNRELSNEGFLSMKENFKKKSPNEN